MSDQTKSKLGFNVIAGVTKDWGLGYENSLPWKKFPSDMQWFRKSTSEGTVIMGRKTWESIGSSPLPKRLNIIVTSQWESLCLVKRDNENNNVLFVPDLTSALNISEKNHPDQTIWVIGGAQLYAEALKPGIGCQAVYLTHVNLKCPTDVKFPVLLAKDYRLGEILDSGLVDDLVLPDGTVSPPVKWDLIKYLPVNLNQNVPLGRRNWLAHPTCYPLIQGEAGYLSALQNIIDFGEDRPDRTGVGTRSLFGLNFRYDISQSFPLLTTKRTFWKGIGQELLWILRGETDSKSLEAKGVNIWQGNTSREYLDKYGFKDRREGDGGPIYGFNMRHWGADYKDCETDYTGQGFDQIEYVLDLIKNNPTSRRILFSMWNPSVLKDMSLPPCHLLYQFYVSGDQQEYLSCSMYQRSGDMGLGVPFNIASTSLLTYMLAHLTGKQPKEIVHTVGDCHVYQNHIEPLKRQIARQPRPFPLLKIKDRGQQTVEDFQFEDFEIQGYWPYAGIKMDMAV